MFYQLLFIHLYRPFLKFTRSNSPLPAHVSPRKLCVQAAVNISKLLRIYKRAYGLKQIVNIAVYIAHTACTIHLLNLPEKDAQRDIVHGLKNLEEMGEGWLCARRTIRILEISANKWHVNVPIDAIAVFERTHTKWGSWGSWDQPSTSPEMVGAASPTMLTAHDSSRVQSPSDQNESSYMQPTAAGSWSQTAVPESFNAPAPTTYYQPSISPSTVSVPTVPANDHRRSSSLQRMIALPEPTYLRPMPSVSYPFQSMPFSEQDLWYGAGQDSQVSGTNVRPVTSPGSTVGISSIDVNEDPKNLLVEESQNWWSPTQNPWPMPVGTNNLDGTWNPNTTNNTTTTAAAATTTTTATPNSTTHGGVPILSAGATSFNLPYQNNPAGIAGVGGVDIPPVSGHASSLSSSQRQSGFGDTLGL